MVGVEYILLHAQEPILYIIRKQQRHSPSQGRQQTQSLHKVGIFSDSTATLCSRRAVSPLLSSGGRCSGAAGGLLHHSRGGVPGPRPGLCHRIQNGEHTHTHTRYGNREVHVWLYVYAVVPAVCGAWDPVSLRRGHVVLPLPPVQGLLVALQRPGGPRWVWPWLVKNAKLQSMFLYGRMSRHLKIVLDMNVEHLILTIFAQKCLYDTSSLFLEASCLGFATTSLPSGLYQLVNWSSRHTSKWTLPRVMSLRHNDNFSHMAILKRLVITNHAHTWWYNGAPLRLPMWRSVVDWLMCCAVVLQKRPSLSPRRRRSLALCSRGSEWTCCCWISGPSSRPPSTRWPLCSHSFLALTSSVFCHRHYSTFTDTRFCWF